MGGRKQRGLQSHSSQDATRGHQVAASLPASPGFQLPFDLRMALSLGRLGPAVWDGCVPCHVSGPSHHRVTSVERRGKPTRERCPQ